LATTTEERYLQTVTVLTPDETKAFDDALAQEPAPIDDETLSAFRRGQAISVD